MDSTPTQVLVISSTALLGAVICVAVWRANTASKTPKIVQQILKIYDPNTVVLCSPNQVAVWPPSSPFVSKVMAFLNLSQTPYQLHAVHGIDDSPTGKFPIIVHGGQIINDSLFIIRYLIENGLSPDPDTWLSAHQRATANCIRLSIENFLYWGLVKSRWFVERNWQRTRKEYFADLPSFVSNFIIRPIVLKNLHGVGVTRYRPRERFDVLINELLSDLSVLLGDNQYLMGERWCTLDATAFGLFINIYEFEHLNPELRDMFMKHENLVKYTQRIKQIHGIVE